MMRNEISLCDLPDEVLNLILGNCDYNTLLNLQFVNKRLKNLIQNEVLWMNQCACSMPIFREIIGLNSTNIQPLSMSVCGVQPNKKSLGKYGLSEKGWKSTFFAYLRTIHSIKQNKQISKNNGKSKYVRSMLAWGVFYIFLLAIVGFALAGGVMIPFAAEALEKGTRPHSFVSFTFSGVVFSIGISVASISMSIAESECIIALLSLASVFLFLPAMWLDGLMKISFSVPLIPYELLYLALIVFCIFNFFSEEFEWLTNFVLLPGSVLSSFASFLLVIFKADGIVSYSWTIAMIPMYVSLLLVIIMLNYEDLFDLDDETCLKWTINILSFSFVFLQSFLLTLRMDHVMQGHFCFYFIPLYLIVLAGFILFVILTYFFWADVHDESLNKMRNYTTKLLTAEKSVNKALLLRYLS